MNKTKIEWCDYTINPVKGLCPMACPYCYARRMYKRFKWNPEIRFVPEVYDDISVSPRGQRILVGSTIELFGDWVRQEWLNFIIKQCYVHPWHNFIFLTRQAQNLIKWNFPENCWVGVSATNSEMARRGMTELDFIEAKVKFLSLEPLLNNDGYTPWKYIAFNKINWVIIGQQTPVKKATMPKIEWIQEIVEACDKASVPVFLKDNLKDFIYGEYGGKYKQIFKYAQDGGRELRQEFPKAKVSQ